MSSPPPPNPTTTAATADFLKSVARQRPREHSHPAIYQPFYNPQQRATTQRQHSDSTSHHQQPTTNQNVAVGMIPNSGSFPPRPVSGYPYTISRPHGFSNPDQLLNPSSAPLQQTLMGTVVSVSANPKGIGSGREVTKRLFIDLNQRPDEEEPDDQPKVVGVAAGNSLRYKKGDDAFAIIRDRKVQVSEGTSLYAQCRSWLKNGFTLENQPQYLDCVKSLPKPLSASMVEARKEDDMEIEEKTENVDHLSAKELLQQHVKHAKKVRVRLRNQRLQRIERYKDRLALLLPPVADQQPKNDPAS